MITFNCEQSCATHHSNGGWCSGLTSSNGHCTWCTALPQEGDWDDITQGDNESIFPPYIMESGKPACNAFKAKV